MDVKQLMQTAEIAAPCTASWDEMTGDEKTRLCAQCNLNVHNALAMTDEEVLRAIMQVAAGRQVCMRIYKRGDGTFLTKDCPVGLRKRLALSARKAAAWLAGGVSMLVSVGGSVSPAAAEDDCNGKTKPVWHSKIEASNAGEKKGQAASAPVPVTNIIRRDTSMMAGRMVVPNYTPEAVDKQAQLVAALEKEKKDSPKLADALMQLGYMHYRRSSYTTSETMYLRAFKIYEAQANRNPARLCALHLSMLANVRGDKAAETKWREISTTLITPRPAPAVKADKTSKVSP